nr:cation:proton antiporter [Angustibacter aerolatus]
MGAWCCWPSSSLLVGAAVGLGAGFLGSWLLRRLALPSSALLSLAVVALAVLSYGAAAAVHASGFLAVYVASLVLGNTALPHRSAVRGFVEALGWLAQIGLFVLLGLLASPSRLSARLLPALVLGLVLLLLARPLSVLVSMTPFRLPWRQQAFLSWAGLRGAVPVVLATVPITSGVAGTEWLFDLVFVLVVVFTLVQAPTLPWFARRLGVAHDLDSRDLRLESAPLEQARGRRRAGAGGRDVEAARPGGVRVRLPRGANITLVVRGDDSFVPGARTVLRRGDQAARRHHLDRAARGAAAAAGAQPGWPAGGLVGRPDGGSRRGSRRARAHRRGAAAARPPLSHGVPTTETVATAQTSPAWG